MERYLLITVAVTSLTFPAQLSVAALPPHIILIAADDLGWNDVGWHNPKMLTKNMDNLAHQGIILDSNYVQPVCSPSRSSFMTGYYPYHTGMQHGVIMAMQAKFVPSNFTFLPQKMKELGYSTHIVGKWHLGFCDWKYTPTERGFDSFMGYYAGAQDYYTHMYQEKAGKHTASGFDFRFNKSVYHPPNGTYSAMTYSQRAVDIIAKNDPKKQPLFLYLPFQSPHGPLEVPSRFLDLYPGIKDRKRRTFAAMVSALDEAIGNITSALMKYGYLDNIVIGFTTDNGGYPPLGGNNWPLRGSKYTIWEGGQRGPGFVFSPNLLSPNKKGTVTNNLFHAVDWFPTLLSAAGGRADPGMDGINHWPEFNQDAEATRSEVVYQIDEIDKNAAFRMGDYKLIEGHPGSFNNWYPEPTLLSKFEKSRFFDEDINFIVPANTSKVQLFNLKDDPEEKHDLSTVQPDIVAKLQQRLAEYRKTMVRAQNPPRIDKANPDHFGGNWSPGWC